MDVVRFNKQMIEKKAPFFNHLILLIVFLIHRSHLWEEQGSMTLQLQEDQQ